MSDTTASDVLMYFMQKEGGQAIASESTSALTGSGSKLMAGFTAGRYFEAEDFHFGIELADDEGGTVLAEGDARSYARWRGLRQGQPKPTPPFRAEPTDVSITRFIDASSPILLKHCLDTERFHQAVLVKRSRIGSSGVMAAILRFEFTKVWLKAIEWADGDTVRETCTFKYAGVKVTYVQRKPDGSPGANWACEWAGHAPGAR